jgi:hypothetical protein
MVETVEKEMEPVAMPAVQPTVRVQILPTTTADGTLTILLSGTLTVNGTVTANIQDLEATLITIGATGSIVADGLGGRGGNRLYGTGYSGIGAGGGAHPGANPGAVGTIYAR